MKRYQVYIGGSGITGDEFQYVDAVLASDYGALAARLAEAESRPNLGMATTGELLDELRARCELNGTIGYRTWDGGTTDSAPAVLTSMRFDSDCVVNGVEIKAGTEFSTPAARHQQETIRGPTGFAASGQQTARSADDARGDEQ